MNQTALPFPGIRAYVAAVRAELNDLSSEEVDDLTGGLEADLAERAAELPEGTDLTSAFGAPDAYAAELRSAADLPPRAFRQPEQRRLFAVEEARLRSWHGSLLQRHSWLGDLRAVWWLLRGAALVLPILIVLGVRMGDSGVTALLLLALGGVLSFVWGRRGTRAISSWPNRLTLLANAAAVLLTLPLLLFVLTPRTQYVDNSYQGPPPIGGNDGAWVNGEMASNLYAYDAQGNRIDRVRLFNQYGQAVAVPGEALLPWAQHPGQGEVRGPDGRIVKDPVPTTDDGNLAVNRSVFPLRWGSLTGWQASLGGWEPPVKISELPAATTEPVTPSGSPTTSTSTSPTPTSATSPSPSPSATS